jgi:DNA-binding LacI/PurR family transcriptional regulator
LQESSFDLSGGHSKALLLLRMLPRPTAIFAGNDMIALGVIQAIRESGLHCPNDVSVLGFDDLDFAAFSNPPLSSVFQPGYQLGATAARILLDRVGGDKAGAKHVVLETQLKIRESIAAPRGQGNAGSARTSSSPARKAKKARRS